MARSQAWLDRIFCLFTSKARPQALNTHTHTHTHTHIYMHVQFILFSIHFYIYYLSTSYVGNHLIVWVISSHNKSSKTCIKMRNKASRYILKFITKTRAQLSLWCMFYYGSDNFLVKNKYVIFLILFFKKN